MALRSVDQIIQDALDFLAARAPNVPTLPGTVSRDVSIDAPSQEFARIYEELDRVSKLQSVNFPEEQTTEELELLAANYGLNRGGGTRAQGTLTFRVSNFTTTDPDISIPANTVATTKQTSGGVIAFETTQAGTFLAAQASQYFNPLTGFFELTLPIQAQAVGVVGNVPAGAIVTLSSNISQIFSVLNTVATTGGSNQESNEELAERIRIKLSGNNVGTANGLRSLALENDQVIDVAIAGPDDSEMLRNEFGGSIDIYILGDDDITENDIRTFSTSGPRKFVFQRQPANTASGSITITGTAGGSPTTFVEGVDYTIVEDPTTLFNNSVQVQHAIEFLDTGTLPDDSTTFTVTYTFNNLIEDLQALFDNESNRIVGSDILVKEAAQALIDVSVSITVVSGFTASSVISDAQTALTDFLTTNQLGQSFNRSDLVGVIEDTLGVDQVDLDTLVVTKNASVITDQRIPINKTEYTVPNTLTITTI